MLNESVASKEILSEGLKYHIDNNKPLTEHLYRAGSQNYFNLWAEARSFYSRGIIEITNEDDLAILNETDLGHFGTLEDGTRVPLDFIMEDEYLDLNEFPFEYKGFKYNVEDTGGFIDDYGRRVWQVSIQDKNGDVDTTIVRGYSNKEGHLEAKDFIENELLPYYGLNEGTFDQGEIAIYMGNDDSGLTHIFKRGSGYYGYNDEFDFEAKDKAELEAKLKRWGYMLQAGSLDEAKNTSLDSKTIKQILDDIDGFPKYKTRGYESFKKEVCQRYKITSKQLEDILHGNLTEAKTGKKKDPPIGKPMRDTSGGKAYKVYVRDPKTKRIKTVRFGSGGLKAKINNSKARAAFAKRHKCSTRNDRTKASYWSCRLPRYAKLLGLKSNFSGFW